MKSVQGLQIPQTLEELCDPRRMALVVYDMQVGILKQIKNPEAIVAKVSRDRQMMTEHTNDPRYGYDRHKGYATAEHRAAVERFGYSPLHRRSFKPQGSLFDRID